MIVRDDITNGKNRKDGRYIANDSHPRFTNTTGFFPLSASALGILASDLASRSSCAGNAMERSLLPIAWTVQP
jgi:hypothetical protein